MPYATVNGLDLYYEMHGDSGEPLILVHGYTGDVTDWCHQVREFSPTHRVLLLDQRGHGRSAAPRDRSVYTLPNMAGDLEALAEQLQIERFHLVGHSMGGGVVQELALRSPQKLLSLTLLDTSCRFNVGTDPVMVAWRERRRHLAETRGMAAVAEAEPPQSGAPHYPPERLQEARERLSRMSVDAFLGAWEGLAGWEGSEDRAHQILVPTLIIFGELDSAGLIEGSMKLGQLISRSTVEMVPEAGHSPQEERPDLFNAALRRFLDTPPS